MTQVSQKCHTVDAAHLHGVEQGEAVRTVHVALRCRRCNGNLYLDPEHGAHIWSLCCLLCNRTAATLTAIDLVERYGVDWRQLDAATWNGATFVWNRVEVAS